MNDGLEFVVAEVIDRAGMARAAQDSDVSGRNVVEMFLVAGRRKELGFIENAQEFRDLTDEIEESGS